MKKLISLILVSIMSAAMLAPAVYAGPTDEQLPLTELIDEKYIISDAEVEKFLYGKYNDEYAKYRGGYNQQCGYVIINICPLLQPEVNFNSEIISEYSYVKIQIKDIINEANNDLYCCIKGASSINPMYSYQIRYYIRPGDTISRIDMTFFRVKLFVGIQKAIEDAGKSEEYSVYCEPIMGESITSPSGDANYDGR